MSDVIRDLKQKMQKSPFQLLQTYKGSLLKSDKQQSPEVKIEGVPPLPGSQKMTQDQET